MLGFFSLGWAVGLLCYKFFFFFFSNFSSKILLGFFFLLESRTNNGAKFNFIGIKKTSVPKYFLKGKQINFLKLL